MLKDIGKRLVGVCVFFAVAGIAGYVGAGKRTQKILHTTLAVLSLFTVVTFFQNTAENIRPDFFGKQKYEYSDAEFESDVRKATVKICLSALKNMGIDSAEVYYDSDMLCAVIPMKYSDKKDDAHDMLELVTGGEVRVIIGEE